MSELSPEDVYSSLEFQEYSLILDERSAYYYARADLIEARRFEPPPLINPHTSLRISSIWGRLNGESERRRRRLALAAGALFAMPAAASRLITGRTSASGTNRPTT